MSPTGITKLLVAGSVITLTIGSIDSGISGQWDLFVLCVVGLCLNVTLLLRLQSPTPPSRSDAISWHGSVTEHQYRVNRCRP